MKTWTPWGIADQSKKFARGIVFYSTPGHGGFKITEKRFQEMPECFRDARPKSKYYLWFEEDNEQCLLLLAFPSFFDEKYIQFAKDTLRNHYPDAYETHYNEIIPEGESLEKDRRIFEERNKNNLVVIIANTSDTYPKMVETVATIGGKWEDDTQDRFFLVPTEEYQSRSRFGFVIDPEKHKERINKI